MSPVLRVVLRMVGFGALVAGGVAVALLALVAALLKERVRVFLERVG